MKSIAIPFAGAGLVLLLSVGAVAAATPAPSTPAVTTPAATPAAVPATTGTIAAILGLTNEQVMTLRQQGLSLAQIADQQKVDPQRLIDALTAQWTVRIDARVAAGALTADQATALKANVAVLAKGLVYQVTLGGMRGAAVGAGPNSTTRGAGHGAMAGAGAGRGGMMRGAGMGAGAGAGCVTNTTAPSS